MVFYLIKSPFMALVALLVVIPGYNVFLFVVLLFILTILGLVWNTSSKILPDLVSIIREEVVKFCKLKNLGTLLCTFAIISFLVLIFGPVYSFLLKWVIITHSLNNSNICIKSRNQEELKKNIAKFISSIIRLGTIAFLSYYIVYIGSNDNSPKPSGSGGPEKSGGPNGPKDPNKDLLTKPESKKRSLSEVDKEESESKKTKVHITNEEKINYQLSELEKLNLKKGLSDEMNKLLNNSTQERLEALDKLAIKKQNWLEDKTQKVKKANNLLSDEAVKAIVDKYSYHKQFEIDKNSIIVEDEDRKIIIRNFVIKNAKNGDYAEGDITFLYKNVKSPKTYAKDIKKNIAKNIRGGKNP